MEQIGFGHFYLRILIRKIINADFQKRRCDLKVCTEHPAEGAVVITLKVAQQVSVGLIRQVHHVLVLQQRAQFGVGGHVLHTHTHTHGIKEEYRVTASAITDVQ